MDDRQLIADLLSALEYHTEQTRPIEFSKVAIQAAREYLQKPAQQEPVGRVCFEGDEVVWTGDQPESGTLLYTSPPAQQEPVAWTVQRRYDDGTPHPCRSLQWAGRNEEDDFPIGTKFYTSSPPQRKPLTDEEIFEISNGFVLCMFPVETRTTDRELAFARAIEKAVTRQPQMRPLTDDVMWMLWNSQGIDEMNQQEAVAFARAIEAAHGIRENT